MTDGKLKRVLKAQNRTKPKQHQQITVQPNEQKRHKNRVARDGLRDKVAEDVAAYLSSGGKIDKRDISDSAHKMVFARGNKKLLIKEL
jgi:hypothetical protein